jgi:twitching motility protein PilT
MAEQTQAPAAHKAKRKPVENIHLDELLEIVVENDASDLHLSVGLPPVLRIDGELRMARYEPLTPPIAQRILYDILRQSRNWVCRP